MKQKASAAIDIIELLTVFFTPTALRYRRNNKKWCKK